MHIFHLHLNNGYCIALQLLTHLLGHCPDKFTAYLHTEILNVFSFTPPSEAFLKMLDIYLMCTSPKGVYLTLQ